jgi:sec-independent protein translocase protein TatA
MVGLESPWHIAILALVLLLVFGSKRLPEIGRSVGSGMREFKRSITSSDADPAPPTALAQGASGAPAGTGRRRVGGREQDEV